MQNSKFVGKALYDMYVSRFGESMDEMKMHKLMYFAQRESLMDTDNLLFDEVFFGWKFGPVLMSVREEYRKATPYYDVAQSVDEYTSSLLERVLARYAERTSWSLSRLSHDEVSWKHAREGLDPEDNGNVPLTEKMMRVDAVREKAQRKYNEKAQV
ncbi:MAG: DUF4065 domain-containing protein [Clostridiales bacterium]|nr:DUF4065 domain-containing protein [Clostridiales bacterium]